MELESQDDARVGYAAVGCSSIDPDSRATSKRWYGKYDLELGARESAYESSVRSTLLEYADSRATSKRW